MGIKANLINSINDRFTTVDKSFFVSEEVLHRMIKSLYAPGPSFFTIFNFENNRIEYISSEVKEVLGLKPENRSKEEVMEQFHEEDIAHLARCQEIIEVFTNKILSPEEWPHYKRTFQYRMIHADGSTRLILHQSMLIHNIDLSYLGKSFILASDISKFSEVRSDTISFIDTRGHHSYFNIKSLEELYKLTGSRNELSTREIEILKLISEGYKSREIAEILHITYDTVRTHRNNILKRHNFNNLTQALAYYIREGFI
jgi:DNA-binding CsgD family transcriptional regulator